MVKHKMPTAQEWANGASFSPPEVERPGLPKEHETFREYRARVDECVKKGFELGDLGNADWEAYCMGSGHYDGVNADDPVYPSR